MNESCRPELSPEQKVVLNTWDKGLAVMAGAGSGKTTTLVAKCAKLIELKPQARFAAVSFTERSASDLRAKLSTHLLELGAGGLHQHWVMTIHGLCGAIIREYPRFAGFDGEEQVMAEAESQLLWERAIESLWLDPLPEETRLGLELLLDRESRDGLAGLLRRVRELFSFGVLDYLKRSEDLASQALERSARFVLERYQRLKNRQGVLDFNDLERGANQALENADVRMAYHRRFELILVDEFQDTNPLQAKIIWKLARSGGTNLCVVGDPKQSIYRFRDADVSVFEEFCSQLPVQQSLTWNFRSLAGIIHFANRVCEPVFAASQMKFEALIPMREQPPEKETVIRLDIQNPNHLADWILGEVEKGIPLHEMALLVRKIRGNEKWIKALTSRGIPIAIGSGGLFWEDPRVRELVAFLKWWDNPGNSLSGAVFLRAPWVGISDQELDSWVKQDSTWRKGFFSSDHPIALAVHPFLEKSVRPGELLLKLLVNSEIESEIAAPLLGLWHRVEEFSSKGLDFHSIVLELANSVEESRREREVPAPRNLGQLTILTIHGSKGLEFPHVILIDFGEKTRSPDTPLLFWDRQRGAYFGKRDENGDRDRKSPQEMEWRDLEKLKSVAESKRLFYVALTRARERLILVCPELKYPEDLPKAEESRRLDFWRAWLETSTYPLPHIVPSEFAVLRNLESQKPAATQSKESKVIRHSSEDVAAVKMAPVKMGRVRHSVTEWTLLNRCPRAYEWTFIRPPVFVKAESEQLSLFTGEKIDSLREGRQADQELGTRVHACLERGDYEELRKIEKEFGAEKLNAEPVIQWAQQSKWMAPADPEKGRDVWTELPFEVPIRGEILVGSIDRIVLEQKEDRKHYSIIDFKITEFQKSVTSLIQAYRTQIELYAWALTALESDIRIQDISAFLVNITSNGVQTVPMALGRLNLNQLLDESLAIIGGQSGQPKPGPMCKYCEFRSQCPQSNSIT